jgi:hypothetical protein
MAFQCGRTVARAPAQPEADACVIEQLRELGELCRSERQRYVLQPHVYASIRALVQGLLFHLQPPKLLAT